MIRRGQLVPVERQGPGRKVRRIRRSEVEAVKTEWARWQVNEERLREREDAELGASA
jgi:hypothetical protein